MQLHIRLKKSNKWEELQDKLYFDDYDVVCLGSPIVAGYPLTIIDKLFSNKAKYLVADLVEDYFLTFDGQRGFVNSEYISMS